MSRKHLKRIVGSGRSIPGFNIIGIVQDGVEQTVKTLKVVDIAWLWA